MLVAVSILACGFVRLLPGDPARMMAGPDADSATIEMLRTQLGLDRPLPVQYLTYMGHVFQGDLGRSLKTKLPVFEEISLRYRPTMYLAAAGMACSLVFGGFLDGLIMRTSDVLFAFPGILLAIAIADGGEPGLHRGRRPHDPLPGHRHLPDGPVFQPLR